MANLKNLRKGIEIFRPRARLISVLGDQLIRDATVGLLELVKNGYDADATHVIVKLLNLVADSKEKSEEEILENITIIIEDDGYGMDLEAVFQKWLEPATGHKEEAKKTQQRTCKGRLPLGEKGVGRFAAHKLGRNLTLISRAKDSKGNLSDVEVKVDINWDKFDNPEAYLNDISVEYEEREPQYFLNNSGTLLEMSHARYLWKERDVRNISRTLRRLMSPFRTPESFEVRLICPDYLKYENLDPGDLLNTAHARLEVLVDGNGNAIYDYHFKLKPDKERKVEQEEVDLRPNIDDWNPPDRKPTCEGFFATFYLWDRDRNSLELSGLPKENIDLLNQYNGVSVFRDGIRVMPYGEPDDDWLEIDKHRYMETSGAISRKNIVGSVEINQEVNVNLRDKSNREGFIENRAFQDFFDLMKSIVLIASNEFSTDRREIRKKQKAERKELIPAVTRLENSVEEVNSAVDETIELANSLIQEGKIPTNVADQILIKLNQTRSVLKGAAEETRQATADTLTTYDEKTEMLLTLAGLGLAAERFTHEFARLTRESTLIIHEVSRSSAIENLIEIKEKISALETTLDALHDLVLALSPMFYIRRKTKEGEYSVKALVENAQLLNKSQIRINKIHFSIDEPDGRLLVCARRSNLIQVFNNLIDNSCYWLSRKSEEDDRKLKIIILGQKSQVIVADNGPGIHPRDHSRIFDPFFTNKVDGRGLGLFIARESLAEVQSTIELIDNEDTPYSFRVGATFCIQFSEEITTLG